MYGQAERGGQAMTTLGEAVTRISAALGVVDEIAVQWVGRVSEA